VKTRYHRLIIATIMLQLSLAALPIGAVEISFTVDPTSNLSLAASFSGINLMEQGLGSLTTTYSGTVTVDVDDAMAPTSIDFLSSLLIAANSGNWLPEVGGGSVSGNTGAAQPANYGGFVATSSVVAGDVYATMRNLAFNITTPGGPLAVAGGIFPSTQTFTVSAGTVDFNVEGGFVEGPNADADDLSGQVAVNQAVDSTYSLVGSIVTLTVPIDIDIDIDISNGAGTANISGTLIATANISTGDFDLDGDVDGNDFLRWQRGESPDSLSTSDLAVWEASFGFSESRLSAAIGAAVPEPSSLILLGLAWVSGVAFRRKGPYAS